MSASDPAASERNVVLMRGFVGGVLFGWISFGCAALLVRWLVTP